MSFIRCAAGSSPFSPICEIDVAFLVLNSARGITSIRSPVADFILSGFCPNGNPRPPSPADPRSIGLSRLCISTAWLPSIVSISVGVFLDSRTGSPTFWSSVVNLWALTIASASPTLNWMSISPATGPLVMPLPSASFPLGSWASAVKEPYWNPFSRCVNF